MDPAHPARPLRAPARVAPRRHPALRVPAGEPAGQGRRDLRHRPAEPHPP
ncbi:hypothetical protein [Clavibacter tessellarius]